MMPCGDSYRIIVPLDMMSYKKLNLIEGSNVVYKEFMDTDMELLRQDDFIDTVDNELNVLLDENESEVFDLEKTQEFNLWLKEKISTLKEGRLKEIYKEILAISDLAIMLKTGLGFDF